jgi:hypothetical protein
VAGETAEISREAGERQLCRYEYPYSSELVAQIDKAKILVGLTLGPNSPQGRLFEKIYAEIE